VPAFFLPTAVSGVWAVVIAFAGFLTAVTLEPTAR
jgi:hypothetical protein